MTFEHDYYALEDYDRQSDRQEILANDVAYMAELRREGQEQIRREAQENNEDCPSDEEIDLDQYLFYSAGIVPF